MVKTGLKVYRNNIWHFFTILGFVALGVIIGLSILIPTMSSTIKDSANQIGKAAKDLGTFDTTKFFESLYNQFKAMNWSDPIKTLQNILNNNTLISILKTASLYAGVDPNDLPALTNTITSCTNQIINTSITELVVLISCTGICSIIGYVLIRSLIHFKTTNDRNIFKYIITTAINILFITLIFYLIVITIQGTSGVGFWFAIVAVLLLMAMGTLTLSFIGYRTKGTKFKDIVNIKTILGSALSDLIIVAISFAIVAIIYPFNALAAIMIAIPLILITTIIMDSTTNAFVNNFVKKV